MRRRRVLITAIILGALAIASVCAARFGISLLPPHVARRSSATVSPKLLAEIDAAAPAVATVADARAVALRITGAHLHFGLSHPTTLAFDVGERERNCIEYAHLFARVFDQLASKAGISARAYAVHSTKARVFGIKVPLRGFEDHDWALIDGGATRIYVDASFYDAGMGWDLASNVVGTVKDIPDRHAVGRCLEAREDRARDRAREDAQLRHHRSPGPLGRHEPAARGSS
jgi:hypothetical protein